MADATQPTPTTYDLVPYPRLAFAHTHPSHLAALAVLLGMTPARRHCRVLEIGCASGSNLIPMALEMPESEFVGVDASLRQVAEGQADIAALGLRNLTLLPMDLAAIDASFGLFDYIIVHGVFSWVPAPLRDKILTICQAKSSTQLAWPTSATTSIPAGTTASVCARCCSFTRATSVTRRPRPGRRSTFCAS
jgi:SAM-dependent methyltransferase